MKLSILVPTLSERQKSCCNLIRQVKEQLTLSGLPDVSLRPFWMEDYDFHRITFEEGVEILFLTDEKQNNVGHKRNVLLDYAKGDYLAFVDDDDRIADKYFELLINGVKSNPDCCSLNGIISFDGINPKKFIHSLKYNSWYEENNIYYRPPNHLNCIKSSIAKQFKFPEINSGEDKNWSMQIAESGLLKNEFEIEETLYFYDYVSNK